VDLLAGCGGGAGSEGGAACVGGEPVAPSSDGADGSIGGYSILEADSREALDGVLEGHPHLAIGTIDVHEFLAVPGM